MTQRLLMLCPFWPPLGGPGVQRVAKFARYLPDHGIQPCVVTRADRQEEDATLAGEVSSVAVHEAFHIPFQRLGQNSGNGQPGARRFARLKQVRDWMQVPDHAVTWVPFAVATAARLIRQDRPTALYTTSPYHSTHLAGLLLKQMFGIPWIADFRDPWAGDAFTNYPTEWHRRANARLEAGVLGQADCVVVVSEAMREDLQHRYPDLSTAVKVIYNGFDPDDFEGLDSVAPPAGPPWTLRHLGTLYTNRRPDVFLEGLAAFFAARPDREKRFRVEFYGHLHADVAARLARWRERISPTALQFHPYVSHTEALRLARSSHALLLIPGPGKSTVTGKIFEYLATGRPILAVAPEPSGIDEVLSSVKNHPLRVPESPDQVCRALESLEAHLEAGNADELAHAPEVAAAFSRPAGAAQLARIIRDIA